MGNAAQILIGKLEILKRFGIDTSKITTRDTIETLARKAGLDATNLDKLEKEGLRLDDKIGISKNAIAQAYRGKKGGIPPTEEQIDILRDEYGISLEKKENVIQVFIGKLEILKRFGIDTSKITKRDTIETLAIKAGLDATNLDKLEKEGLRLDDKIGISRNAIAQAYRGKDGYIQPTEEQIDILRDEYGISLEKKENVTQVFIGKLEILKRFGIDTSKITSDDTIETLARKARIRCNRSR